MNHIKTVKKVIRNAPFLLLLSIAVGFMAMFIVFLNYYVEIFNGSGFWGATAYVSSFFASLMTILLRFSFALSGSIEMNTRGVRYAAFGFGVSAMITAYNITECFQAANVFFTESSNRYPFLFMSISVVLWTYIGELRFCFLMAEEKKKEDDIRSVENVDFERLTREEKERFISIKKAEFEGLNGFSPTPLQIIEFSGIEGKISIPTVRKYMSK